MSLKTGFAQIFSCCPKFGGAAAPLAPPARTPMAVSPSSSGQGRFLLAKKLLYSNRSLLKAEGSYLDAILKIQLTVKNARIFQCLFLTQIAFQNYILLLC